ncbi:MAG: class I SAM-dependent methyltransferase [Candidatus Uhrbacteria bacterium]
MSVGVATFLLVCITLVMIGYAYFAFATLWSAIGADAPWVPLGRKLIHVIAEHCSGLPVGVRVIDLGSGDGRILFAVASLNAGATCVGVEQSRSLVAFARLRAIICGASRVVFRRGDFVRFPIHDYDVVICYLWPNVMRTLAEKFRSELRPGAVILSARFAIPGWTHEQELITPDGSCFVYRIS